MSGMNQRLLQCLAHAMGGDIVWIDSDLLVAPGMPKHVPWLQRGAPTGSRGRDLASNVTATKGSFGLAGQ